jgi:primosomal protein N' (replication factor Y)
MSAAVLRIAVPCPLHTSFDYLAPKALPDPELITVGARVRVPFGRKHCVGIVLEKAHSSALPLDDLKHVDAVLDTTPIIEPPLLALAVWAARYYHYPVGEIISLLLPPPLRRGNPAATAEPVHWRITPAGRASAPTLLRRAPRQAQCLLQLMEWGTQGIDGAQLVRLGLNRNVLKALAERGWVEAIAAPARESAATASTDLPLTLHDSQAAALAAIGNAAGMFRTLLLDGVTGSGKTEVYLQAIAEVLQRGHQALVLVPEIGLTPQLVERLQRRFPGPLALLHSGLSDGQRLKAWQDARSGAASIVIGTRSAVFAPLAKPGLIIVDEEHDPSFKQQEGLRYSARDVAVMRGKLQNIPVVLGSATPSLESLHNMRAGRYVHLAMPQRAGAATPPTLKIIDLRNEPLREGLAPALVNQIGQRVQAGDQVLLFLNRRGYAPVLLCHTCGWVASCPDCDARLTFHLGENTLRCHHCGLHQAATARCPACGSNDMVAVGKGTERIDHLLRDIFPGVGIARIDRDTTRRKGSLQDLLDAARSGRASILIGTQMLAKGHHFPNVTLVGIVDVDQSLFSVDFRAPERLAQTVVQVAGRAGRAERPGEVLIQTHHPAHPMFRLLISGGYPAFAEAALRERESACLPPYASLALLRADATDATLAESFLAAAAQRGRTLTQTAELEILGPVAAPMSKRAGRFRAQLLIQAPRRSTLQHFLEIWTPQLAELPSNRRVRWSLDVDAIELY